MNTPRIDVDENPQRLTSEELVRQLDSYIIMRVTQKMQRNAKFMYTATFDLDVDEVIQQVRVKLWNAAQKQEIRNLKVHTACLISTTIVDLFRSHKRITSLPLYDEGEPYVGNLLIDLGQGLDDPSYEVDQEASIKELLGRVRHERVKFPPSQRFALLCALNERIDDPVLRQHLFGNQLATFTWLENPIERQRAS
jgi:hypothetical protein